MRFLFVCLLALVCSPCLAIADGGAANAVCDECHAVPDLRFTSDTGERKLYTIDPGRYAESAHAGARCVDCHDDGYGDTLPHSGRTTYPLYLCVDCHEGLGDLESFGLPDRREELVGSVHGKVLKPRLDCHDCHDPHVFDLVSANDAALDRIHASNALCLACHGAPAQRAFGYEALNDAAQTHDWFPNAARHLARVKCVGCHSPAGPGAGHDILPTADSLTTCEDCHSRSDPRYLGSYSVSNGAARDGESRATALDNVYVIGSTRSVLLDRASQIGFAFFLLLVLGHGVRRGLSQARYRRLNWMHVEGPRGLKAWHLLQVLLIAGLLVSGLSMHYGDSGLAPLSFRLAVRSHNVLGVANIALWLGFVVLNARSGNLRHYVERLRDLARDLPLQARYYAIGVFAGTPEPFPMHEPTKFNPIQRVAYLVVMYGLVPTAIMTGAVLLYPLVAPEHALGHPGLWPIAMAHLATAYGLTMFIVVHVYMTSVRPPDAEDDPTVSAR